MKEAFDPYRKWLGILPKDQPPNHYRLLNIELFEEDVDVIVHAMDARTAQIRTFKSGEHATLAKRILDEIKSAGGCLLDPSSKAAYDSELQSQVKRPAAPPRRVSPAEPAPLSSPAVVAAQYRPTALTTVAQENDKDDGAQSQKWLPVAILAAAVLLVLMITGTVMLAVRNGEPAVVEHAPPPPPDPNAWLAVSDDANKADGKTPSTVGKADANASRGSTSSPPKSPAEAVPEKPVPISWDPSAYDVSLAPDADPDASETPTASDTAAPDSPTDSSSPEESPDPPTNDAADGDTVAHLPASTPAANPAATAAPSQKRHPVPDSDTREKIEKEVRGIFTDELKEARTFEKKLALSKKFVEQANASDEDPNTRFVVLRMACDLAAEAADPAAAMAIVDLMHESYDVRLINTQAYVITHATESLPSGRSGAEAGRQVAQAAIDLANEHADRGDYDTANGFAKLAVTAARKAKDAELINQINGVSREIARKKQLFAVIQKARDTLSADPADPEANMVVGRWFCLTQDQWKEGLPHLAKGSNPTIAKAAQLELKPPSDAPSQASAGDAWFEAAQQEKDEKQVAAFRARAEKWYTLALPSLEGLDRVKAKKRLDMIAAAAKAAEEEAAKKTPLRGFVQKGNVALATNGSVVTGAKNAGQMIDGNSTRFSGSEGFASGSWPCEWTVTFPKVYRLQAIRFLLWNQDSRYFRYAIAISEDGETYKPFADCSKGEWRGWQVYKLPSTPVKSVKIYGLYNSANSGFFIVEFEAYCQIPR